MKTFLIAICLIGLNSCEKNKSTNSIPSCIQDKIDELKNKPKYNPPAKVIQYNYNGKTVYYITSDGCDQFNNLFDSNCNLICAPDGGFTGHGDGKCSDFENKKNQ